MKVWVLGEALCLSLPYVEFRFRDGARRRSYVHPSIVAGSMPHLSASATEGPNPLSIPRMAGIPPPPWYQTAPGDNRASLFPLHSVKPDRAICPSAPEKASEWARADFLPRDESAVS